MTKPRWDILIAALMVSLALIGAAMTIAPHRYQIVPTNRQFGEYIRIDQKTGSMIQCELNRKCREVVVSDELDSFVGNVAREVGDQ